LTTFLQRKPLPVARELLLAGIEPLAAEEIAVEEACGRVTAEEVLAQHPAPHYQASAMDGIAVRARDTFAASAQEPVRLTVWNRDEAPPPDQAVCRPVDTGSLLPPWADAVVRIEEARAAGDAFEIRTPSPPGRDLRVAGEDIDAGTVVVPAGHRLRAYDLGALLATGNSRVLVRQRPSVGILATGNEVVEPNRAAAAGQVIEYNSRVLAALIEEWGGQPVRLGIFADNEDALLGALDQARRSFDVVCAIAGSSAGRKDLTIAVLQQLGDVFVHGVDIAPGRPVALARIGTTPVLAVPGYPVAAIVAAEQLLQPLLARLSGTGEQARATLEARVGRKIVSRTGIEEFRRVCLTRGHDGYVVGMLPQGAGSISTITGAHGWLRIPPEVEGLDAGSRASVELIVTQAEVDASMVVSGSPCEQTAALERALRLLDPRARVMHLRLAGLDASIAVERGEAHLAVASAGCTLANPAVRLVLASDRDAAFVGPAAAATAPPVLAAVKSGVLAEA